MPTEDAYSSGHLVLSHFGTCMCSNVETNLSWPCLVSGPLNFEHPSVLLFCLNHRQFMTPLLGKTAILPMPYFFLTPSRAPLLYPKGQPSGQLRSCRKSHRIYSYIHHYRPMTHQEIQQTTTQYHRIEHSTTIRQTRDGQREGLRRIKFVTHGTPF